MKLEEGKLTMEVINHQFKILGLTDTFADIPEDGMIQIGKKKVIWYEYYHFTEDQEKEWRDWAKERLKNNPWELKYFDFIDLRYGFSLDFRNKETPIV